MIFKNVFKGIDQIYKGKKACWKDQIKCVPKIIKFIYKTQIWWSYKTFNQLLGESLNLARNAFKNQEPIFIKCQLAVTRSLHLNSFFAFLLGISKELKEYLWSISVNMLDRTLHSCQKSYIFRQICDWIREWRDLTSHCTLSVSLLSWARPLVYSCMQGTNPYFPTFSYTSRCR